MIEIAKPPIRTGCYVTFDTLNCRLSGTVVSHEYTELGHQFCIRLENGRYYKTSGSFLYRHLVFHKQGRASRRQQKKSKKKWHKKLKRDRRRVQRMTGRDRRRV